MGKTRERRAVAQERWPLLSQVLGGYFHQDYDVVDGSVEGALAKAMGDTTLDQKQMLLREWWNWNQAEGATDDIRRFLDHGFGIALHFETPVDARNFMNGIYDSFIRSVRQEAGKDWKP